MIELFDEDSDSPSSGQQLVQYDEERGRDAFPSSSGHPRPSQALTRRTSPYSSQSSLKHISQFGLPSHDPHDQSTGSSYRHKYVPQSLSPYSDRFQFSSTFSRDVQASGSSRAHLETVHSSYLSSSGSPLLGPPLPWPYLPQLQYEETPTSTWKSQPQLTGSRTATSLRPSTSRASQPLQQQYSKDEIHLHPYRCSSQT